MAVGVHDPCFFSNVMMKLILNRDSDRIPRGDSTSLAARFFKQAQGDACRFIASGTYRMGWIVKTLFKKKLDQGLSSIRKHMQEEGKNLKRIMENSE